MEKIFFFFPTNDKYFRVSFYSYFLCDIITTHVTHFSWMLNYNIYAYKLLSLSIEIGHFLIFLYVTIYRHLEVRNTMLFILSFFMVPRKILGINACWNHVRQRTPKNDGVRLALVFYNCHLLVMYVWARWLNSNISK